MFTTNLDYRKTFTKEEKITNIVCEGGGILGSCYPGAFKILEKMGILENIKNFTGSSAGIIFAFLLVLGFTPDETDSIVKKMKFAKFLDSGWLNVPALIQLKWYSFFTLIALVYEIPRWFFKKGLCRGKNVKKWFEDLLIKRGFDSDITLYEFYKKTGKGFYILVSNMSKDEMEVFSYKTTPEVKVIEAISAAMAIQGIYQPVKINGDLYGDGGLGYIYPIELFDELGVPGKTLGLVVNSKEELLDPPKANIWNGILYLINVVVFLRAVEIKKSLKKQKNVDRTIFIDTFGISMLDFGISNEMKEKLLHSAKVSALGYYGLMEEINE